MNKSIYKYQVLFLINLRVRQLNKNFEFKDVLKLYELNISLTWQTRKRKLNLIDLKMYDIEN